MHLIFWGRNWNGEAGTKLREEYLSKFYNGLRNSTYQGILTQYFEPVGNGLSYVTQNVTVEPPFIDTRESAPGETASSEVNHERIEAEVHYAITQQPPNHPWARGVNSQFVVIPAPGAKYGNDSNGKPFAGSFCSYHSVITEEGVTSTFTFLPDAAEEPFYFLCSEYDELGIGDRVTSILASHEYSESVTDPEFYGWTDVSGYELGDICGRLPGDSQLPDGAWVQGEWADDQHACSIADENPLHVLALSEPASTVTKHEATLNATINPEGKATEYHFEYGPTTSYGKSTGNISVGEGVNNEQVSQTISGLELESTYHYRVVASNGGETAAGEDQTITPTQWLVGDLQVPEGAVAGFYNVRLTGVSCAAGEWCMSVGWHGAGRNPYAQLFSGGKWTVENAVPVPGGAVNTLPLGVSCVSTAVCMMVGEDEPVSPGPYTAFVERWNGTQWLVESAPLPSGATESSLEGVSCASATECMAVGRAKNSSGTTVPYSALWKNGEWSAPHMPTPTEGGAVTALSSVSCASARACLAVGRTKATSESAGIGFAESWNGEEWSIVSPSSPAGMVEGALSGVSCTSSSQCMAVGAYYGVHPPGKTNYWGSWIERWSGTGWSEQTHPKAGRIEDSLNAVRHVRSPIHARQSGHSKGQPAHSWSRRGTARRGTSSTQAPKATR